MRIITPKTLVLFYSKHSDAEKALEEWREKVESAEWTCFADVKNTFNSVDYVGNKRYVFNIKGNDYRLVALILFKVKILYVRFVGTHSDYDKIDDISKL